MTQKRPYIIINNEVTHRCNKNFDRTTIAYRLRTGIDLDKFAIIVRNALHRKTVALFCKRFDFFDES